ncbi:MAG: HEAT repeat domain-containing protein [Spirochaetes bacterium]|nr:HEAT repeat domain-containing protein [Spirochaetota bacterium]
MLRKKLVLALAMSVAFSVFTVTAQDEGEEFAPETIRSWIIRETARSTNLEQKLIALQFVSDLMEAGETGREIIETLEFLAIEGIINQTFESGRLTNNFPTARREAVRLLGVLGTEEARQILVRAILAETESMVLAEAVRSLGVIGTNPNDQTASAIAWAVTRFDTLNPNNLLALSAIDTFQILAGSEEGVTNPNIARLLVRISEGSYVRVVRERAHALLMELIGFQQAGS